ncbi:peptidase M23 [Methylophilales bacterium MBRSG12]|uniref:Peptidase M23 n=1 Tax=Methylophilales bacterium MBRS-H7 TaxID=1623450 RepID=A0A0H4IZV5_9PROT|nr:peptidase M23 [Methylophilales bacterium MBRSF5]AKO66044.1 peptidase M23 [Methylophilales bacterium MBRS-H7]AKO67362.1 peptidase M23 [Methylophilales bacterium MBRSG12]
MKILFISKNNTKKPVSINIYLFVFFIIVFVSSISAYVYNLSIKIATQRSEEKIETLKLDLDFVSYQRSLQLYIQQIGEMNARLTDLDNQTERLQGILKKQIVGKQKLPKLPKKEKEFENQGGPFINNNLTEQDVQIALQTLMNRMQKREDIFNETESILLKQSVIKDTLPDLYPVSVGYRSSSYGWRIDPMLGVRSFHEGLDFSAAEGDDIKATASGIVIAAGKAPDYGNYVKIKHGGGIETRYAHASKLLVKKGDLVNKDQVIALVGNTGRSTGPHLHYEIRLNGRSLDPRKYLKKK